MTDDQQPSTKRKPNRATLIGVGVAVAVGAGAFVVLNSNQSTSDEPAVETAQAAAHEASSVQTAHFSQTDDAPNAPQTPPPPAEVTGALSADGGSVNFKDETLTFDATFPPGPANDPALTAIRNDALTFLASRKAQARATFDEMKKEGNTGPAWPWEVMIGWEYTARAGDIISLAGSAFEFSGGAHGNVQFDTHVARTSGAALKVGDMLQGGITPALVIGMCEALKVEKVKRIGAATVYDDAVNCAGPNANVKIEEAKLALASSSENNKFGGILVYWGPYAVGPYVEGPYEVVVQQEVFAQDLRPEFKPLFGGTAPPV
ncbi:MAG TPA: DUF4163 domain-containing protein [Hyphomonadaceae bacterium]|nr:DUF4163 domain-containing protein [Hyphomonadaceae bacterium]HPN05393.1 DUF4163 domain-containing protein [Hyphomonadaceae bacterium]